jgi:4-amino-4-deoxy-L-arabinose transferase-like glycosyltransferase
LAAERTYSGLRFWVLFLAGLAFVSLGISLVIVTLHAAWPSQVPTAALNPLVYILGGSSMASVVLGASWFLLRYPAHRRVLVILLLITGGIMAAHLYTIDTPPAFQTGTLTGPLSGTASDSQVNLNSSLSGSSLGLTIMDSGSDPIGSLAVSVGSTPLPDTGLNVVPTPTAALQPGSQVTGSWSLPSGASGELTVSYQYLTCYDSSTQVQGCVMDEVYYIPAAQAILSGEKCGPYLDNCNLEHPFLSKAIIAAGMAIFGDNTFGWRFFEALLGTASIPVVFGICWALSKDSTLSIFAAFLTAFETLLFVQSSIAVIDIQPLFFALVAFLVYVADIRIWRLDRITLSAILLGLAALSKETAVFLVVFLVLYNLLFGAGDKMSRFLGSLRMFLIIVVVFCAGLQLYVTLFGNSSTTTFLADIKYILDYGASLKCTSSSCGWTNSATFFGAQITPFNWVTFYGAVGYFVTRVTINPGNYTYVSVGYWGITNFFEVWLTYLWAPYTAYLAYKLWISRSSVVNDLKTIAETYTPSYRLARFALLWFVIVFFSYVGLYFYGRVTYPYYILPAMPAISMGCAFVLTRRWFPREVAYVILAGVFLWFFLYYPDKAFLPSQLRMFLEH